jgi:3-isopropylmalate dehydrogenase
MAHSHPDIAVTHQYADNVAMQLIQDPKVYDVIFTANLFGDLLSDVASVLAGSIGLPAAAMFNEQGKGFYEPGHGTALDIAGMDKANPIASIRTVALMLRYSFDRGDLADLIELAIADVLQRGVRTQDIAESGSTIVSTSQMGQKIVESILTFAK